MFVFIHGTTFPKEQKTQLLILSIPSILFIIIFILSCINIDFFSKPIPSINKISGEHNLGFLVLHFMIISPSLLFLQKYIKGNLKIYGIYTALFLLVWLLGLCEIKFSVDFILNVIINLFLPIVVLILSIIAMCSMKNPKRINKLAWTFMIIAAIYFLFVLMVYIQKLVLYLKEHNKKNIIKRT